MTFSGSFTEGPTAAPSLIDGNYTLTVFSSQVVGGMQGGDNVSGQFHDPFIIGRAQFDRSEFLGASIGTGTVGTIDTCGR